MARGWTLPSCSLMIDLATGYNSPIVASSLPAMALTRVPRKGRPPLRLSMLRESALNPLLGQVHVELLAATNLIHPALTLTDLEGLHRRRSYGQVASMCTGFGS